MQLAMLPFCGDSRLPVRFWAKVQSQSSDCWEWTAYRNRGGYGVFGIDGRRGNTALAHRLAYETLVESIPSGLECDHLCRNRACVNPAHIEAVTRRTNVMRGVGLAALNAVKTHCPKGHEYSDANTIRRRGKRWCRRCHRDSYV